MSKFLRWQEGLHFAPTRKAGLLAAPDGSWKHTLVISECRSLTLPRAHFAVR
jgi:hypothetical protein